MPAIGESPFFLTLYATKSTLLIDKDGSSELGESQEDEKDDVSSPPSEDFSSVSADKVIRDGEDDGMLN